MKNKIKAHLAHIGMEELPDNDDTSLTEYGFDSLMIVLLVVEIEKNFGIRIPGALATQENFDSVSSIESLLKKLGAK